MRRCRAAAGLAAALLSQPAEAAIIGTCTIVVTRTGEMMVSPSLVALDSALPGGTAARATVTASSTLCSILNLLDCYSISALVPASFSSQPSGAPPATFATTVQVGAAAPQSGATPQRVSNGSHAVEMHLAANSSAGAFAAGSYRAEIVLRCE